MEDATSNIRPAKKSRTSTVLKVFAWLWCVAMALTAIALAATGVILPAVALGLSAFLAAPPSWRVLSRTGIRATRGIQVVAVVGTYAVGILINLITNPHPFGVAGPVNGVSSPSTAIQSAALSQPVSKPPSKAEVLKAMTAKISDIALQPLDPKYDPEGYAKLGKRVWGVSNDLRRWAGIAALQNDACKGVSAIAVWERATRSQLSWHVVCGEERFVISEAQARSLKARLDPDATDTERQKYAVAGETAQPMSAAFANFSVAHAVVACDNAMEQASVDKGSFDASWSWDQTRNEETGEAIISREYSAKNAMGGTISGKYRCVINAADGNLVSLTTEDAFGAHTVY